MKFCQTYIEKTYAGVLGKMIGVYLGRPVEGWLYEDIKNRFGEVNYYVHDKLGLPLIVADDDLSGTFGFYNAIEDNGYTPDLSAKQVGDAWLNYIIENKTILWWGGPGRSTGNTVFLNLKRGIPAPQSGSIAQNGKTVAEQIGAQIFMDAYAMTYPDDPDKAVDLVRKSASVAYDGLSIEAAGYLAALESMAYSEANMEKLLTDAERYLSSDYMKRLNYFVRNLCAKEPDWRKVRSEIDKAYGYDLFHGTCHVIPNHAIILASLVLGGDDFQRSIALAVSSAWDTDCNAANVGCINGIRLGLEGINAGADFRGPMADQLFVVTADGGAVVSDSVQQTRRIIKAAAALRGEEVDIASERFAFEMKGSVQGFVPCPYNDDLIKTVSISNLNEVSDENGLVLHCNHLANGLTAEISTPVFIDFKYLCNNYSTVASPTLYESQTVHAKLKFDSDATVTCGLYALYYDASDNVTRVESEPVELKRGMNSIDWEIPASNGMPYFRIGVWAKSYKRFDGDIILASLDWKGAPAEFKQSGKFFTSIFNITPNWTKAWTSSASNFEADNRYTYSMSHKEENGLATIGTNDWTDYSISSSLELALNERSGLVARVKGHRQYYGALLRDKKEAVVVMHRNNEEVVLARADFPYELNEKHLVTFEVKGNSLKMYIDEKLIIDAKDEENTYPAGATGFLVSNGSILIDGVNIRAI